MGENDKKSVHIKDENFVLEEIQIKFENNGDIKEETPIAICRTCLIGDNLKDMMQTYYYQGKPEVYSQMLAYCFCIQVSYDQSESHFICEDCIQRLRDATLFKNQAEAAQQNFSRTVAEKSVVSPGELLKLVNFDDIDYTFDTALAESSDECLVKLESTGGDERKTKKKQPRRFKKSAKQKICSNEKMKKKKKAILELNDGKDLEKKPPLKLKLKIRKKEEIPYKLDKTDLDCKLCGEKFPVHKNLQLHMNLHFQNHICECCGRGFSTRRKLRVHRRSHTAPALACPHCPGRRFKGPSALNAHVRVHHGKRQLYKCSLCNIRFESFNSRRKHMVETHGEENKKYACKHCPKKFCLGTHLAAHIRNVHLQERRHECNECGMTFFRKEGLAAHMLKHTGERSFKCTVCGKTYGRKYTLTEHMKIHNNDRRHVCAVCGKSFTQKGTLKGHLAIHAKEAMKQEKLSAVQC